jgi:hypothetical protein
MQKCERLNLLKVQGEYLQFIVDNLDEIGILEHIEKCKECKKEMLEILEKYGRVFAYGNLFDVDFRVEKLPNYKEYEDPLKFIYDRIKWRKKKLNKILKNAEIELRDLEIKLQELNI